MEKLQLQNAWFPSGNESTPLRPPLDDEGPLVGTLADAAAAAAMK